MHSTFFDSFFFAMATLGSLGVLLDFLAGLAGQRRHKDMLINWWVLLSETNWRNFASREARVALRFFDRFFGEKLFSWKRLIASLCIGAFSLATGFAFALISVEREATDAWGYWLGRLPIVNAGLLMVPLSLSITRFLTNLIVRLGPHANGFWFGAAVAAQIALYLFWTEFLLVVRLFVWVADMWISGQDVGGLLSMLAEALTKLADLHEVFKNWMGRWQSVLRPCSNPGCASHIVTMTSILVQDLVTNGLRLVLALIFLSSYIFRPLVQRPITLLIERIVESKTPVCTLVFGGIAAIGKFIQEALK